MPYAYYKRLNRKQKKIYNQSDAIASLALPDARPLKIYIRRLEQSLSQQNRQQVEQVCRQLLSEMTHQLDVPPVRLRVMAVRPSDDSGELHGEYELALNRRRASICVWMRTAKRRQVVAFRSFLRTVLHELCHHLDYTLLNLADSFHTEGFYKRESSLFNQLVAKPPQTP